MARADHIRSSAGATLRMSLLRSFGVTIAIAESTKISLLRSSYFSSLARRPAEGPQASTFHLLPE